ncbi:M4 family metallopeptidase [Paenimyroides baculatum]|uniref:T9SS type A sorting domain-containing protein n=1 Tax=Paenimyroides baculatum TaxID=2608000 RepID=A0A5M6CG91_9FLAO|nr:M4 family metallopeptidase [Paenimyroides baculatum]KAA5534228.1 T9SS type A sorting domain-containing protein [Paenimyroides baculatum]
MNKNFFQVKKISTRLILAAILLAGSGVSASNIIINKSYKVNTDLPKPQYQNRLGTFMVDMSDVNLSLTEFSKSLNSYFDLDKSHRFELVNEKHDSQTGFTNYSYQHFYKDVKINGDIIFLHVKEGKLQFVNGQVVNVKELSTSGSISEEKLKSIAYDDFGRKDDVKVSTVETYILKHQTEKNVTLKLVNKINLTSFNPAKSIDFVIDAQTGEILSQINKVMHADTPSSSATYFRGTKSITVDSYNGNYRLMDNARKIRTLNGSQLNGNLNSNGTFSGFSEYTNSSPNYTSTNIRPAVEVHWGMIQTYDYYKNIHNRASFDDNNHDINNYYNAGSFLGTHDNAAAFDAVFGNDVYNGMFYGRGSSMMHPVVALDVAGHEFTHMVVSRNGNGGLDYQGESGALNESFADIFGTAIEFYVNDNPNWTIGEGIFKSNINYNYFRSMSDPNTTPAFLAPNQSDTYEGNYWANTSSSFDNGGVHINSGVGNHWFYLLSVGGMGINDLNNNYYVNPITIQKAEKIAYKALTTGLTPTATYLDAYNATIAAAITLYGANSNEWEQVVNAWYAVGIGDAPASTKNYEMQSKLKVYPNPTTGNEVTIESELDAATAVEMYDLAGRKVLAPTLLQNRTTINVAGYKTGMYILKFKSNQGEYSHKLMIK